MELSRLLSEGIVVDSLADLRKFLNTLSDVSGASGILLNIGDRSVKSGEVKRKTAPDYLYKFKVNETDCSFMVYNPKLSAEELDELSQLVSLIVSKYVYSDELKRIKRKLSQTDRLWEPFVSSTNIERLIRLLPQHIGEFLGVEAVSLTIASGKGTDLRGFWSKSERSEERIARRFKRLCIPLKDLISGASLGYIDLYYKGDHFEKDPLVKFVSDKLSACFSVFLSREELEEKLEYFNLFFHIGNLFRKTSEFRKRVELALWALCYEGGFGFNEAAYFIYDEKDELLKGFIAFSGMRSDICEEAKLPSDQCIFSEIRSCFKPKESFWEATPYEIDKSDIDIPFVSPHIYALPLVIEDKLLGCFVIGVEDVLDQKDTEMLTLFAQEVALAFESAKLQEAFRKMVAELKEARESFTESEKLKTLGEFLARVVHDIKNPLVAVSGLAKRLYNKLPEDYPEKSILKMIVEETNRALSILTDVLSYVRQPVLKKELFDINELIDEIIFMESTTLRDKKIVLYKNLDRSIPKIKGDSAQIRQVILNLITNAIQAMSKGGTLIIKTSLEELEGKSYVKIEITDTGGGIPPEIVPNIFNPFFTTKSTGTGLGLSTSKRIVELHGGFIKCINNYPVGATFLVYLPVEAEDEKKS